MARFNIQDVVSLHGIIPYSKRGSEYYFICPACGEKGACSYNPLKNTWHDWKCDAGGGPIELHIAMERDPEKLSGYEGTDGKKAAARDIFSALDNGSSFTCISLIPKEKKKPKEAKKASDEHCSRVYKALLKELKLENKHYDKLIKRGLSHEQIKRFCFKSVPRDTKGISKILCNKGYVLEGVPGFFLNKGVWDFKIPYNRRLKEKETGTLCPVYDGGRNLLLGFQVNVDKPRDWDFLSEEEKKEYVKYVWISSKDKEKGVTSGSVATYLPGKGKNRAVIVTEGILNATVIYCLLKETVTVIGIPGVKLYKAALPYLERLDKDAYIFAAYDMDRDFVKEKLYLKDRSEALLDHDEKRYLEKLKNLKKADLEMCEMFTDQGFSVHELRWDIDSDGIWQGNYKGLDDFLNEYEDTDRFLNYILKRSHEKEYRKLA